MMILYVPPYSPITRTIFLQVKYQNFLPHENDATLFELKCM
jgi:hypothetical protein